jgi:hypothetical protein
LGEVRNTYLIALLTALGLALSDWHLHFSRLGFRGILLPLFSTLAFYFFWRSLTSSQRSVASSQKSEGRGQNLRFTFHISGNSPFKMLTVASLFTALAIYSYLGARLLPLVPLLYWVLQWFLEKLRQHLARLDKFQGKSNPLFNPLLLTSYFLLLLLFLSPLMLYFAFNPADFVARSTAVSIFNPTLPGTAWRTLIVTLGTFLGLQGDPNPLVNLPGQPALPIFLTLFFCLGLLTGLYHAFVSAGSSPHLFLLCWWLVMLLPAILAPEGAPHHLRLIGTLVPTYAFVAIGLAAAANFLRRLFSSRLTPLFPAPYFLLPIICFLLLAFQTYTNYFIRWPVSVDFTLPFDLYAVRLAGDIAHAPASVEYILPMDLRAGEEARHYTLDYLLGLAQSQSYTYIPVDEQIAPALLTQAAQGKDRLRVVRWADDKHREADAKEIITFLLETTAQFQGREAFPVYEVETYALPDRQTVFALPAINQSLNATFDQALRLEAAYVPASAARGGWLPVALTLAPLGLLEADYKASVRLVSPNGERVAQKDRVLLHNYHQGTSLWPPEAVNEYYLLSLPSDLPPGDYSVVVVVYHPETQAPLVAAGQVEAPLGHIRLE